MEHELAAIPWNWHNTHTAECPVTRYREKAVVNPRLEGSVREGVLIELDKGGDEEQMYCNCGAAPQRVHPADDLQRLKRVAEAASDEFWLRVAKAYPEVTTGDFDPLATDRWSRACEEAVRGWLLGNYPTLSQRLIEAFKEKGITFAEVETGGGCQALRAELEYGYVVLITGDEANLPEYNEHLVVGLYHEDRTGDEVVRQWEFPEGASQPEDVDHLVGDFGPMFQNINGPLLTEAQAKVVAEVLTHMDADATTDSLTVRRSTFDECERAKIIYPDGRVVTVRTGFHAAGETEGWRTGVMVIDAEGKVQDNYEEH